MKILVMSLLRIGDIVLSTPVLRGLRERHPNAQIHLLINSQFKQIAALIPYVDRVISFERDLLQKGLGEAGVPLFDSYERMSAMLDELNGVGYDMSVNLTHSRLSGWLMNLVNANEKIGLCFDHQGRASFGSSWFRYLNNQVDSESREVFHFTDVFRFALGVDDEIHRPSLIETDKGRSEADAFVSDLGKVRDLVAVQALTSDTKKDWGMPRWVEAITQFSRVHPTAAIAVLGAPFERERLEPLVQKLAEKGVNARLAILSFEGAFSLLRRCRMLITGDTSVKHLACAARTPVVEVSLGSSDLHRTGAYLHGSVIIQSREACAPCQHSRPCHRETHACASRIPTDLVAMVSSEVFSGRCFQLATLAEEYKNEADVLRVETRDSGFWAAYSVLEPFAEESVGRWLDLASRKVWLQTAQGRAKSSDMIGSETLKLAQLLRAVHPNVSEIEWRHLLSDFEKQAELVEGRINGFKASIRHLNGCYEDPARMREFVRGLIAFRERIRHSPFLRSFKSSLDQVIEDDISPPFSRFRRIVDAVSEIERRTAINLRIVRALSARIHEESGLEKT